MPTIENEIEILRVLREIKYKVGSLPMEVADQVADRLKGAVPASAQVSTPEPVIEEAHAALSVAAERSEEIASAQAELAEITEERDKAKSDLEAMVAKLMQHEARLEEVSQKIGAAEAEAIVRRDDGAANWPSNGGCR